MMVNSSSSFPLSPGIMHFSPAHLVRLSKLTDLIAISLQVLLLNIAVS